MKIVVLPGSFNPITKAHAAILDDAVTSLGAGLGLFLAVNGKYLTGKMLLKTKPATSFILSEAERKNMIDSLNQQYPKLIFGGFERGGASPDTYKDMVRIQKQYPGANLYLMVGADKLANLPNWKNINAMLSAFQVVVFGRGNLDAKSIISNDPFLNSHANRIHVLNTISSINTISSSTVRNSFFAGTDYSNMMDPGPLSIMQKYSPANFPPVTTNDLIKANLEVGGRFGANRARVLVYQDNKNIFNNWDPAFLGDRNTKLSGTQAYSKQFTVNVPAGKTPTITDCVNADCADVAETLIKEGYRPAILNLASAVTPCGGYQRGLNAQEESLCRSSTLSQSLYQFGDITRKHVRDAAVPNIPGVYPLDINFGGIYSPDVTFFRYDSPNKYALRKSPFSCGVVSVASLSNRDANEYTNDQSCYFNEDGTLTSAGRDIELNKIRTIFRIALDHNHDAMVLGAFGCGVYKLLPVEVVALFNTVLNEPEFKDRFKKIVFAILEGKGNKKNPVGANGKNKPFYDIFAHGGVI